MNDNGYILITVLLLCLLMLVSATVLLRTHAAIAHHVVLDFNRFKAQNTLLSAYEIAFTQLKYDNNETDGIGDKWFKKSEFRFSDCNVKLIVTDEQSKINLNQLILPSQEINQPIAEILEKWAKSRGKRIYTNVIESLRQHKIQWVKKYGHEPLSIGYYRNEPVFASLVSNINDLDSWFTIFGDGSININSSSSDILDLVLEDTRYSEIILEERKEKPFENIFQLKKRTQMNQRNYRNLFNISTFRSSFFQIYARVEFQTVNAYGKLIVQRNRSNIKILRCREWFS